MYNQRQRSSVAQHRSFDDHLVFRETPIILHRRPTTRRNGNGYSNVCYNIRHDNRRARVLSITIT